jgi:polyisoprenyl-teichoic acid--peptidoglycan teichoic acid transferase
LRIIPNSRRGALWRFALGAVIVVAFTAATTAVAGLLQFKQFAAEISITPPIKQARVTIPDPGNPQTILIIGSDHRAGTPFSAANTDTMMLVRLDPNSQTINVLSIPRDLKVEIPEAGDLATAKLNSAYSIGGPNLLVKTIKQNVFPHLQINHIVDVNFSGFEALVNAIGCVYTDVDHRYYNNTAITDYSSINLQAGYQKLCGSDALSFVRFRHTDSDIVRNARQQDFIRWAKDQYGAANLIANRDKLLKIFGEHTETDPDLHSVDGLINMFQLVAFSAGHTIKQIPFPAIFLPCDSGGTNADGTAAAVAPCYVTADPGPVGHAYRVFMAPTRAHHAVAHPTVGPTRTPAPVSARSIGLTADVADGRAQAAALKKARMPVYFPRLIVAGSSYEPLTPGEYPRAYHIHDQSNHVYAAYRIVVILNSLLGQYYGVQGTTWRDPPILGSPSGTRTVNGRQLALYANGGKLSVVAWHTRQGVYWISNTLTDNLTNQQMIAIAASLTRS